jgi:hypothetical protein
VYVYAFCTHHVCSKRPRDRTLVLAPSTGPMRALHSRIVLLQVRLGRVKTEAIKMLILQQIRLLCTILLRQPLTWRPWRGGVLHFQRTPSLKSFVRRSRCILLVWKRGVTLTGFGDGGKDHGELLVSDRTCEDCIFNAGEKANSSPEAYLGLVHDIDCCPLADPHRTNVTYPPQQKCIVHSFCRWDSRGCDLGEPGRTVGSSTIWRWPKTAIFYD